jgi:uncharacterized protein (DUF983 family)
MAKAVTLYVLICRRCGCGRIKFGTLTRPRRCASCGKVPASNWSAYSVAALPVEDIAGAPDSAQHTL